MTILLSDVKKQKIRLLCIETSNEGFPLIWKVASLLEKISSSFPTVQFSRLHYQALEKDKTQAMKFKKGNFRKKMIIFSSGKNDIYYWLDNISTTFKVISKGNSQCTLVTDSYKLGFKCFFHKWKFYIGRNRIFYN